MTRPRFRLGTSGWGYDEWRGPFYLEGMKSNLYLPFYSEIFDIVEINVSFYRLPTRSMTTTWAKVVPDAFKFAAKIPQEITHKKLLRGSEDVLRDFLDVMKPLGKKIGPFLLQLPPSFDTSHMSDLESFLAEFPTDRYELAVEFRHMSWLKDDSTWRILENNNCAYCVVDEPLLPPVVQVTADFGYIRWHGHGRRPWYNYHYSPEELEDWVPRVQEIMDSISKEVYGFFNNHPKGNAPSNASQFATMVGMEKKREPKNVNVRKLRERIGEIPKGQKSLSKWIK